MTPIERAARALQQAWDKHDAPATLPPLTFTDEEGRYLARAVLLAIREPSEGMVTTAVQQVGDPSPDQWALGERANATLTATNMLGETACAEVARDWQAMIDAALSE